MNRRQMLQSVTASTVAATALSSPATAQEAAPMANSSNHKPFVQAKDGTNLYVQDWGGGRPMVFLSAWTFNSLTWGEYIAHFTAAGNRCLALDRRGHGRSDAPCHGYDADTLADDVAALFDQRDLRDAILVAHSMGSIEAVRYLARHGAGRVGKLVLIAPTTPFLLKTGDNPDGVPEALLDGQYGQVASDFAKWISENESPFFTADTIAETRAWIKAMMLSVPLPVALACNRSISHTDTRQDVSGISLPTLILHGDRDASAPLPLTGAKTAKLLHNGELKIYEGAPHALPLTHREKAIADIGRFIAR